MGAIYLWIKHALLTGIGERVADIKTRAHAMKCLTTFCESVGPGFIFERVSIVMPMIYDRWCIVSPSEARIHNWFSYFQYGRLILPAFFFYNIWFSVCLLDVQNYERAQESQGS